jgi:hypothetical protein
MESVSRRRHCARTGNTHRPARLQTAIGPRYGRVNAESQHDYAMYACPEHASWLEQLDVDDVD